VRYAVANAPYVSFQKSNSSPIEKKVLTENYQQRAREIKAQLDIESGIDKACYLIEAWLL
jgi:hypothetical protein